MVELLLASQTLLTNAIGDSVMMLGASFFGNCIPSIAWRRHALKLIPNVSILDTVVFVECHGCIFLYWNLPFYTVFGMCYSMFIPFLLTEMFLVVHTALQLMVRIYLRNSSWLKMIVILYIIGDDISVSRCNFQGSACTLDLDFISPKKVPFCI